MAKTSERIQHDTDLAAKQITLIGLEQEYHRFVSAAFGVDERGFHEGWLDGRWGVAEIVAGHTGWLEKLSQGLRLAGEGVPFEQIDLLYLERWEDALYIRGAGKPRGTLLRDLTRAYQQCRSTAVRVPAHHYGRNGLLARMVSYVGVCKFRLHASLIEAWSEGRLSGLRGPSLTKPGPRAA
jgi:hypothetical protein